MSKQIIWEKWVDPMGANAEEDEFVGEKQYDNEYDKYEQEQDSFTTYKARPAALTAFGIVPINHYNNPNKSFNFWVGHTNFKIGENTFKIMDETPGVEILDLFSPYRFRISVAKAFTFSQVRQEIEKRLSVTNPKLSLDNIDITLDKDVKEKLAKKIESLKSQAKYWIIYITPNSKFEVVQPGDLKTFQRQKQILENTRSIGGGLLIASDVFGV